MPGWANTDSGLLISLSAINDLEYSAETGVVRAGFGNTWGGVYSFLEERQRMALGGRAPSVGLALLTGGMPFLYPHYDPESAHLLTMGL